MLLLSLTTSDWFMNERNLFKQLITQHHFLCFLPCFLSSFTTLSLPFLSPSSPFFPSLDIMIPSLTFVRCDSFLVEISISNYIPFSLSPSLTSSWVRSSSRSRNEGGYIIDNSIWSRFVIFFPSFPTHSIPLSVTNRICHSLFLLCSLRQQYATNHFLSCQW